VWDNLLVDTKRTRHAAYQINYHLVWCAKFGRPVLETEVGKRLAELIPPIVEENGGEVLDLTPVRLVSPHDSDQPARVSRQREHEPPIAEGVPRIERPPAVPVDTQLLRWHHVATIQGYLERQKGR
jgi:hypothetical protein